MTVFNRISIKMLTNANSVCRLHSTQYKKRKLQGNMFRSKYIPKTNCFLFIFLIKHVMSLCRSYCRWFMIIHWQKFRTCFFFLLFNTIFWTQNAGKTFSFTISTKWSSKTLYSHSNAAGAGKTTTGECTCDANEIWCAVIGTAEHMFIIILTLVLNLCNLLSTKHNDRLLTTKKKVDKNSY